MSPTEFHDLNHRLQALQCGMPISDTFCSVLLASLPEQVSKNVASFQMRALATRRLGIQHPG
jgi:hypothetical protein